MSLHAAIGILVAVALPLWLVVEQVLKWRVLGPRTSATPARTKKGRWSKAQSPGRRMDVTGAALHRKTS